MTPESIIKQHVKKSKVPGISVGLIKDGKTKVFNYGQIKKESEIEPTENTVYEIGSMTKTFTAILASKLEGEKRLSLQEPITKFLPELKDSEFDENKITLRHLITHTSGISEYTLRERLSNIFIMMFRMHKKFVLPKRYYANTPNFLTILSKMKLKKHSSEKFRYSNTGIGLVGKILERVTDSTYEELLQSHICNKLDMKDTGTDILESHRNRLATGYSHSNRQADYWDAPGVLSAGSICSTVSDMLKFLNANLSLRNESDLIQAMEYCKSVKFKPKMSLVQKIISPITSKLFYDMKSVKVALGWAEITFGEDTVLMHDGSTEGFSSIMMIHPEKNAGVVVLTNKSFANHYKLSLDLLRGQNKNNED